MRMRVARSLSFSACQLLAAVMLFHCAAAHADIAIVGGGAVQHAVDKAAPLYETATKVEVAREYMPMGPLMKRLAEGLDADVIIVTEERMAEAKAAGAVDAATVTEIGRVGIGVAVNENALLPDISTPEAFKQTLLAARSIVYIDPARGTSGAHFAKLLDQLGIAEAMKPKTTLGTGGAVVAPVGRGEIELGVQQITEILPVKGVKLVGPLPAPLQKISIYQGAVLTKSAKAQEAKAFLDFMRTPSARQLFKAAGFIEP